MLIISCYYTIFYGKDRRLQKPQTLELPIRRFIKTQRAPRNESTGAQAGTARSTGDSEVSGPGHLQCGCGRPFQRRSARSLAGLVDADLPRA